MKSQVHTLVEQTSEAPEKSVRETQIEWTRTTSQAGSSGSLHHLSNNDRATTITVVLEQILTKTDFPHGGINE